MIKNVGKPGLALGAGVVSVILLFWLVPDSSQHQSTNGQASTPTPERIETQVKSFYGPAKDYVSPSAKHPMPRTGGALNQFAFPPVATNQQTTGQTNTDQTGHQQTISQPDQAQNRMTALTPVRLPPALQARLGDTPEAQYAISEPIISQIQSGKIRQALAENERFWQPVRKPLQSNFPRE